MESPAKLPTYAHLQWHITDRCNNRCLHCYQDNYNGSEPSQEQMLAILEQYEDFLYSCRLEHEQAKGHLTITGGEPFVRSDFFDFLEILYSKRQNYSYSVLTNGSFIYDNTAKQLAKLKPREIQLSIEGSENTHDSIRGKGDYLRTTEAIKLLVKYGIAVVISFTVHQDNYREFDKVARLGYELKVNRVWADRIIPFGSGSNMQSLTPQQTREFFGIMKNARHLNGAFRRSRTEIAMHRALQFVISGEHIYNCQAGRSLLALLPNGDLLPCRRMPVKIGNVFEKTITELYLTNQFLNDLRNCTHIEGCVQCRFVKQCQGGLKCLSFAVHGSPFIRDPGCWV